MQPHKLASIFTFSAIGFACQSGEYNSYICNITDYAASLKQVFSRCVTRWKS